MTQSPLLLLLACMHPYDPPAAEPQQEPAALEAATMRARIEAGTLTAEGATEASLERIAELNPLVRAVIATHPAARTIAGGLDAVQGDRGPLHGVPILLKDNVDATGMPTTAGSLALKDHVPADDAFLVARIKEAGAVIVGKANLSEWANFRSTQSTSGWSGMGGQCRNPHVLDRTPCGSSSGSAVAVASGMVPLAIGTETDGSILCPSSINGIVGVKPTVGLVSRDGVVPISHSQDTAGPMARTVRDAAMLLEVIAVADDGDPAAAGRPESLSTSYTAGLEGATLEGARIGVIPPGEDFDARVAALFRAAVEALEAGGATVVEVAPLDPEVASTASDQEWAVLVHEFKPDLEAYLATVSGIDTLQQLIGFNEAHAEQELRWFGQDIFELAAKHVPGDPDYPRSREASQRAMGAGFIDARLAAHDLEALVAITSGTAWPIDPVLGDRYTGGHSSLTAVSGYPAVTVPMGRVEGLPVGISFLGAAWTEARLLQLAHAYEQATNHRVWPTFRPTVLPIGE